MAISAQAAVSVSPNGPTVEELEFKARLRLIVHAELEKSVDGIVEKVWQDVKHKVGRAEEVRELGRKIETMGVDLKAVAKNQFELHKENGELRDGKAALEQMQREGLFGFAEKIDVEARALFLVILGAGNLAKASRDLKMKDSTLRSQVAKWRKRGKVYRALAEFVRWRKSIRGQAGIDFAKRLVSGVERDVDYAALVRDAVEELEQFNPDNWEEKCANLADALRMAVS